jgi:NitT/TauT family transport system permease protein
MNLDRFLPWIGIGLLIALWEGAIHAFDLPPYVLPKIGAIAGEIVAGRDALLRGLIATLYEAGLGYVIGAAIGIVFGFLATTAPSFERAVMPIVVAVNSVPIVAYVPVALVALGMGPASKIAMVIIAVGFTVFLSAVQGLNGCDSNVVNLLRSFGAGAARVTWSYRLPAALPTIISALRVAVVRAMIVAIVAEMLGAYEGLGRIIYESTQQIQFLRTWAAITVASAASVIIYSLFVWADRKLVWWK